MGLDGEHLLKRCLHPSLTSLGEDRLEVAFEESAGVVEILFGVGFGAGEALKRFVEDADDPLLFDEGRKRKLNLFEFGLADSLCCCSGCSRKHVISDR